MYLPDHFAETRAERLHSLIGEYPLATLVTVGSGGLVANHIPFLLDDRSGPQGTLIGHVARRNDAWNYAVVHVYGRVIVHEDAKWLRGLVGRLTKAMESAEPVPWKMGDAPQEFLNAQLEEIVGIEIPISRMIGKWKVSQNRPVADRSRVVDGLRSRDRADDSLMAELVSRMNESDK
jgi:transcriptional regulator